MEDDSDFDDYKITKLTGKDNYDRWEVDMQAVLMLQNVGKIAKGKYVRPAVFAATTTPLTEVQEIEKKKINIKVRKWDKLNKLAVALIILNIGDEPRAHIRGMEEFWTIWTTLKTLYKLPNEVSRDLAFENLLRSSQSKFDSVAEYGEYIKIQARRCANAGYPLQPWVISKVFRMGLNKEMELYMLAVDLTLKTRDKELELDDILEALRCQHRY